MPDPLSAIDNLLATALTGFADLTALVPEDNIQVWDREVDVRGEVETASDLAGRIWVVPAGGQTSLGWSSGSSKFVRRFSVGFGVGKLLLEDIRKIEWQIIRALARLGNRKQPDGVTPIEQPAPLEIESIEIGDTDPDREPLSDPEEWTDVCDVTVIAFAPRAAILA